MHDESLRFLEPEGSDDYVFENALKMENESATCQK